MRLQVGLERLDLNRGHGGPSIQAIRLWRCAEVADRQLVVLRVLLVKAELCELILGLEVLLGGSMSLILPLL